MEHTPPAPTGAAVPPSMKRSRVCAVAVTTAAASQAPAELSESVDRGYDVAAAELEQLRRTAALAAAATNK